MSPLTTELGSTGGHAMTRFPCRFAPGPLLRVPADLDVPDLAFEEILHVPGARVVVAEYDVLQHDFPELRTEHLLALNPHLGNSPEEVRQESVRAILDDWLIANAAFVSTAQVAHGVVNTVIETDGCRTTACRPPKYGRAVVVPVRSDPPTYDGQRFRLPGCKGLLDLKGAGVSPDRIPSSRPESSGLEYLGMALSDFIVKKAIDEIFARELPTAWTVPVYAVLDLGFDTSYRSELGVGPAGLHVRRAHRRRLDDDPSTVEEEATFEMEQALRRYGVTAATVNSQQTLSRSQGRVTWQRGRRRPELVTDPGHIGLALSLLCDAEHFTFDWRDLQLAREVAWPPAQAHMVDFGAIRIMPRFEMPVVRSSRESFLASIVWPGDPDFRETDENLQLPVDTWGRYPLAMYLLAVAKNFRQGVVTSAELRRQLDLRLLACVERWPISAGVGPVSSGL